jgi:hypothetical protein
MAKSIFEILADLKTTTSVPGFGEEVEHTIPAKLFPSPEQFEDGKALLAWSEEHGYTHALLQKGIQKGLIDIRATFKSCKKADTWSVQYGQANVDATEWTITNRPNQAGKKTLDEARFKDCMAMISKLVAKKMDIDTIKEMTTEIYGEEIVTAIFKAINKNEIA